MLVHLRRNLYYNLCPFGCCDDTTRKRSMNQREHAHFVTASRTGEFSVRETNRKLQVFLPSERAVHVESQLSLRNLNGKTAFYERTPCLLRPRRPSSGAGTKTDVRVFISKCDNEDL